MYIGALPDPGEDSCKYLANAISGTIIVLSLVVSELLPFTNKIKAGGLLHFVVISLAKYYEKEEEQTSLLGQSTADTTDESVAIPDDIPRGLHT